MAIAAAAIGDYSATARAAFWLPRLVRFADWFAATEALRRIDTRLGGRGVRPPDHRCTRLARSRSPRAPTASMSARPAIITDYKSGQLPKDSAVIAGTSPQLPLEAAMLLDGSIGTIGRMAVTGLRYIRASGGEPAGEAHTVASRATTARASPLRHCGL